METSIASLLGGMASKSQDSGTLQKVLDTVSGAGRGFFLVSNGRQPCRPQFVCDDSRQASAFHTLRKQGKRRRERHQPAAGLTTPGSALTMLSMAAPVVMSFLTKRLRDGGMNINSLGALLQRESGTIQNALPAGMSELFWPATTKTATTVKEEVSPVVAQAVQRERSGSGWLAALAIAALGLGLLWFLTHARKPTTQVTSAPMGTANRMEEPPTVNTACRLPSGVNLPADGVASRLLGYVQGPGDVAAGTTWFNADELRFNTGDATLRAGSQEQLNNIGEVMKSCPNVHLTIAGYTDNVGDEAGNARLSKNRASAVRSQLVADGVSSDRLSIEGYGQQNPVADNSTAEGRAENRRVALQVTQK